MRTTLESPISAAPRPVPRAIRVPFRVPSISPLHQRTNGERKILRLFWKQKLNMTCAGNSEMHGGNVIKISAQQDKEVYARSTPPQIGIFSRSKSNRVGRVTPNVYDGMAPGLRSRMGHQPVQMNFEHNPLSLRISVKIQAVGAPSDLEFGLVPQPT